ncbi:MAG TPA: efflux RND transporter periplasmic adaptor subunit [Oleiagrimonas sp.]|nr:efflux RND transporter periplasmic adaptor subunit [Oleiagrimonas sp.]
MGVEVDNGDLLKELRIERAHRDDHDESPRRWPWLVLALVVLLTVVAGGLWWWSQARAVEVHTVTAVAPSAGNAQGAVLQATGYVTARRKATVSAQIVGTLTQVLIEEGDHVKKGQVLARLEDTAQKARLNAAKASVGVAKAQVHELDVQLDQAKRDMQRQNKLAVRHLVPEQQAEQARTKVANLAAQLHAQRQQVKSSHADEQLAQVNYDYTIVRAPFAGVITQKTAQVGEIIAPAAAGGGFTRTGVGTIVDMDSLEVDVDVNEAYISRVKPDMPATAVLDAYPDWNIPAHVIAIVPTADRGKATVKVRVALEKKDPRIIPDMGVRVSFLDREPQPAKQTPKGVLVPATAIVERDHHEVVFVVHGDTTDAVRVSPAQQSYGDLKLIPEGVSPGATVVDKPPQKLADGMAVKREKS